MKPQYIFIHHTGVSYKKNPDQWRATDKYHKSLGWSKGGYNYEVSSYGGIHQFRADGAVTAAQYQQSMNDGRAISICLDGNFDEELPTDAQRKTTAALIQEKAKFYNIPLKNIRCHRSVATYKSCPGILLPDDIYTYFLTAKPMDKPKPSVTEWAKEAWAWGLKEGFIHEDSEPTLEFQRALVLDYRIHKKYAK